MDIIEGLYIAVTGFILSIGALYNFVTSSRFLGLTLFEDTVIEIAIGVDLPSMSSIVLGVGFLAIIIMYFVKKLIPLV